MTEKEQVIKKWLGTGSLNVFGRPFAGKNTQAEILADKYNGVVIAGGDILRGFHDQSKIQALLATGNLFPTEQYLEVVLPYFEKPEFKQNALILSSVGRMKGEETVIVKAAEDSAHPLKAVILLDMPESEVWDRLENAKKLHDRGDRSDDKTATLKNRLERFAEDTMPVIEFYRQQGLLIAVDGTKPRDEVARQIEDALYERASS